VKETCLTEGTATVDAKLSIESADCGASCHRDERKGASTGDAFGRGVLRGRRSATCPRNLSARRGRLAGVCSVDTNRGKRGAECTCGCGQRVDGPRHSQNPVDTQGRSASVCSDL